MTAKEPSSVTWSNGNPLERKVDQAVEFAIQSAKSLISWLPGGSAYLRNKTVLEVGPGQDMGIPLILMGFGASVILVDRYLCQWDPDFHPLYYRKLRQAIVDVFPSLETDPLDQVIDKDAHAIPNLAAMKVGIENIHEVPDASVHVTYSNATFEHLTDPARAIHELARVTRPGGLGFHQIDFRDHRDFEHPLEYLTISQQDLELQLKKMAWSFGNGVRSTEFESMFRVAGFHIAQFEANLFADEQYLAALQPRLQTKYKTMPPEALRILGGRFYTIKPFSEDPCLHSIFSAYADRGYPVELITTWALPSRDARKLVELIEEQRPDKVLEVGTFVGVSTLMMAAKLRDGGVIHTVDPNFPLTVELEAMNTPAHGADLTMRHQELASAIAERLGLAHKIVFHAGGFSTPATFASTKHDTSKTVPVIGLEVCEKHGPFDLIFIDGLHYTDAVLSDLRLASRYLSPGGRIVVHDVIGMWGSNVRRAAFQFLVEAPEFNFQHGRYADIYESIGLLEALPDHSSKVWEKEAQSFDKSFLEHPEFMENLAAVVCKLCLPKSAIYLGQDRGRLLWQLSKLGVERLIQVSSEASSLGSAITEPFDFRSMYKPKQRFDLCICLPDHDLAECSLRDLVASCVECSDTVLFGSTPPGEAGISGRRSLPIESWVREFWKHGYRFYDQIRPHFEPLKFANSYSPIYAVDSSELSNLYLVRRESAELGNAHQYVEQVLVEKERRIEDLMLQGLFSDIALQHMLKQFKAAQDLLVAKDKGQAKADRVITEQEALIHQCENSIRQHEDTIREKDECLRQRERALLNSTQEIEERDRAIARIEQSIEYRVALRLGRYPRLLRLAVRCWRALFRRQ